MISVHTTRFTGTFNCYDKNWVLPWHQDSRCRGMFRSPIPCETMTDIKLYICEYVWSPCIWKKLTRSKENFVAATLCVLDFDDGVKLEDAVRMFKDYKHIIGTTKSHQKDKKGVICDRFRVVLEFAECIQDLRTYEYNQTTLIEQLKSDPATKDGGRLFAPCKDIVSISDKGKSVAVKTVPPPRVYKQREGEDNKKYKTRAMKELETFGLYGEGNRNAKLLKIAISMAHNGWSEDEIFNYVKDKTDLDESEIKTVVRNGCKYSSGRQKT